MTSTITQNPRIYPGLICNGIEFFLQEGNLKVLSKGRTKDFIDAPYAYHQILEEAIDKEPEVNKLLQKWYPNSKLKRLVQFGSCRFGGLDFQPDVVDFKLQPGEYRECPLRGSCKGEGIICKAPVCKGEAISFEEVKLIKLLVTTDTNENIATKLKLAMGTLHLVKKNLYQKLKIQTKQELAIIAMDLNLI